MRVTRETTGDARDSRGQRKSPRRTGGLSVSDTGIEPATSSVSGKRATAAPIAHAYSVILRGEDGIRTRVDGFAGRCLASRPLHQRRKASGGPTAPTRADDEIRTRDPNLGKVVRYHCATSAFARISACFETITNRFEARESATRSPRLITRPMPHFFTVSANKIAGNKVFERSIHDFRGRYARGLRGRECALATPKLRYDRCRCFVQMNSARAIGAVGSALRSHRRGHRFESGIAHPQSRPEIARSRAFVVSPTMSQ